MQDNHLTPHAIKNVIARFNSFRC